MEKIQNLPLTIYNFIIKVTYFGTHSTHDIYEKRRIRLTNFYLLISFFSSICYSTTYKVINYQTFFLPSLITDIFSLVFLLGLFLSYKRKFIISRYIFSLFPTLLIGIIAGYYFGKIPFIHIYFLLFAMAQIMIWDHKQYLKYSFFVVLNIFFFVYTQFVKSDAGIQLVFPADDAIIIGIISTIITFVTMGFVIFFYRHQGYRNETVLQLQAQDLMLKNEEIIIQNQKLIEVIAAKDKLFSIIAHDLRNPIGTYKNLLDVITEEDSDITNNEVMEILTLMKSSSSEIYDLLINLLQWSNSEIGNLAVHMQRNDLTSLINKTLGHLHLNISNKKIAVSYDDKMPYYAYFDNGMISTVLRNIISNAIKFTPPDGAIKIYCHSTGNFIEVNIEDNGVGIKEEDMSKLFSQNNYFTTTGTNNERGTGLGLKLCWDFIRKNNGNLTIQSVFGKGTIVKFTLPVNEI